MRCSECKYFEVRPNHSNFGKCNNQKLHYGEPKDVKENDHLLFIDYEEYTAFLYVGLDFGCVHFEEMDHE